MYPSVGCGGAALSLGVDVVGLPNPIGCTGDAKQERVAYRARSAATQEHPEELATSKLWQRRRRLCSGGQRASKVKEHWPKSIGQRASEVKEHRTLVHEVRNLPLIKIHPSLLPVFSKS